MSKNCVIFGGGSKLGRALVMALERNNHIVYPVSSSPSDHPNVIEIDWYTCDFVTIEKACKKLPRIDVVIFNQNYCEVPEFIDLHLTKPASWRQGKCWMQAHFVNSVLPCQVLNSLFFDKKFNDGSVAIWMLSGVISNGSSGLLGYRAQKTLNWEIIKSAGYHNKGTYLGFDPGLVNDTNQETKASVMADWISSGIYPTRFYQLNQDSSAVIQHSRIV